MATEHTNSQISRHTLRHQELIVSLRQWCEDNGVKIRLTHENHIVIQERKQWEPPEPPPEETIWIQDLIFVDCGTSIFECE